ncbi:hypothetical protein PR202_gb12403 [Eleusine coracana subsp. coracana]|uniref:Uncharacterized protein n=1 Tax=Eleusine coracana subsp. coracana TaxID=191504 RepID=A0AAV5EQ03_ELECO|nr:hypothetical protein PR202_gb12403 [Eleusine coracana subsp. coracana]
MLVKKALSNHLLLLECHRTKPPLPRVCVSVHHHPLDLSHRTMVASRHHSSGHLSNTSGNRLTLGRHEDHLLPCLNVILKPEQPRNHELSTITDRIHSRVLHNKPLVASKQHLQRHDNTPQVTLVLVVVKRPHGVHHIVHGHHVILLPEDPRPDTAQLLHMRTDAKQQPEVDAERTDICARLARDPEHGEVTVRVVLQELALVDGPHPELAFDRGDERRALEHGTRERLERACHPRRIRHGGVEPRDADVLLPGALLRLDEAGGAVDADDEVARDLGVEGAAVAGLLGAEDALDPGHHLVGGRVGGLVEVDDAVAEVLGERALQRRVARGERGVVAGADVEAVVVLQEERPGGGVERRHQGLGLD